MLASKCFRSSVLAATRRPKLSAYIPAGIRLQPISTVSELLETPTQSVEDNEPPKAPSDSHPRLPPQNPLSNRRKIAAVIKTEKPIFHLCWKSTRHNTVATFTDATGNPISWATGGTCGFKHSRRGEYEAGYQCAVRMFKQIEERLAVEAEPFQLEILFKGFGQGRTALESALMTSEGENVRPLLCRLTDRTPLKIGGTRARKARRL